MQQAGTSQSHGATILPTSVHQAQERTHPARPHGYVVDSTGGSDISLMFPGAGGSNSGNTNGGNGPPFPPPLPPFPTGTPNQVGTQGSAFTVQVKPKDPPVFHRKVLEDVVTWTTKVRDFFYLTAAKDQQQVAYVATLLQDAASGWWNALLRSRGGHHPHSSVEFSDLLECKFGSASSVDRARVELRNIQQGQSETVRIYSTRFEALLGKLPSFDMDWAKSQFIWGLHKRVAELVTIAAPSDLHSAIRKAKQVELARQFAYSGGAQQQPRSTEWRGRGRAARGRFAAAHVDP